MSNKSKFRFLFFISNIFCFACFLGCFNDSSSQAGEMRSWTDFKGRTIQAEYGDMRDGKVSLFPADDYPAIVVELDSLSRGDQDWIRQRARELMEEEAALLYVPDPDPTEGQLRRERLAQETFRTWTDHSGKNMRGRLLGYEGDGFVIIEKEGGEEIRLRPNQFSESDITYLKEIFSYMHVTPVITLPPNPSFDQRAHYSQAMLDADADRIRNEFQAQSYERLDNLHEGLDVLTDRSNRRAMVTQDRADSSEIIAERADAALEQMMNEVRQGGLRKPPLEVLDFGKDLPYTPSEAPGRDLDPTPVQSITRPSKDSVPEPDFATEALNNGQEASPSRKVLFLLALGGIFVLLVATGGAAAFVLLK